jgi:autophagy-related protein 11
MEIDFNRASEHNSPFGRFSLFRAGIDTDHYTATDDPSDMSNQVRALEEGKQALERELQNERGAREAEVAELTMRNEELRLAVERSRAAEKSVSTKLVDLQADKLRVEGDLQMLKTRLAYAEKDEQKSKQDLRDVTSELEEVKRRMKAEQEEALVAARSAEEARKELGDRLSDVERQREALQGLAVELETREQETKNQLEETRAALERELHSSRADAADTRARLRDVEGIRDELERQLSRELSDCQTKIKELSALLEASESRQRQLGDTVVEKEKELRDLHAEAELDRAVLERELEELRVQLKTAMEDVSDGRARLKRVELELEGARSEITRRGEELDSYKKEADAATDAARRGGLSDATRALRLAKTLYDSQRETIASLATDTPEGTSVSGALDDPDWSALDSAELEALLEMLSAPMSPGLGEAVKSKVDSLSTTIKKWQKECKNYRERAQRATAAATEKIAFRK